MNWTRISETRFHLLQDEKVVASMEWSRRVAECRIGTRELYLRRKGFWGNRLELTDHHGQVLATVIPAGLAGSSWTFTFQGQEYRLTARNNPLAEYVILQDGRDVVAYGLKTVNGRLATVITDHRREKHFELDLLLWYLFHPVGQGETGDPTATDLLLLTA